MVLIVLKDYLKNGGMGLIKVLSTEMGIYHKLIAMLN
jgi:hypothetical protein